MAAPKLSRQQQQQLLCLLAADYSNSVIFDRLARIGGYPEIGASLLSYYRGVWRRRIERAREARLSSAVNRGLALQAERIQRLSEHADELEMIKWVASENGRLWNERAWRETLDDIAREMGERRPGQAAQEQIIKVLVGVDVERV